jgi:hypothetical protein
MVERNLIKTWSNMPAASLNGSHTVSSTAAALCAQIKFSRRLFTQTATEKSELAGRGR